MKKSLSVILMATEVFATWQYRLTCVLIAVWINRKWIYEKLGRQGFRGLMAGLLIAIFIAVPHYFKRGRTQLVYINENGERPKGLDVPCLSQVCPRLILLIPQWCLWQVWSTISNFVQR